MNINKNGFGSKYTNNPVSHGSALKRGGSTSHSDNSFTPSVRNIPHHQQQQQQYNRNQAHCYSRNVQSPSGPDDGHLSSAYTSRQSPFTIPDASTIQNQQHALDSYLERFKAIAELKAVRKLESLNARSNDATTLVQEFERECAAPARTLLLKIVSVDLEYFQVHRCERIYWKFLCYSLLDKLNPGDGKNQEQASFKIECLSSVLSDNDKFYQALSDVLSSVYHFAPSNSSVSPSARKPIAIAGGTSNERIQKLCIFLAHWIAVARGDLARYAPDAPPSAAAEWYNAAIQLYPKMGHAYNQMGVVSVSARKPLDALYYFTRSLAAPFPSQSAHHSLQALFEDIRRRSVAFRHHAKLLPPPGPDSKGQAVLERLLTKTKTEIWIRPDGCENPSQNGHSPPGLLTSLGLPETEHLALGTPAYDTLKRCFVLNFIHCHAKLYTRTDVESFEVIARDALTQFQALLNLGPSSGNSLNAGSPQFLTPTRLLQIFAINMFAVERCSAASRSLTLYDPAHRPLVLERALQLSVEMFAAVIALFGNRTLPQQRQQQLLPCARIWVDWMLGNTSVWNPLPGPILEQSDFGNAMATFANRVVALSMEFAKRDDFELLKSAQSARLLQEDCMLRGFVPLLMCSPTSAGRSAGPLSGNADKALNGAEAQKIDYETALRIEKIKPFGDVLMGLDPAVLDYDKGTGKYVSLIGVDRTPPQHDEIPTENLDELYTHEQLDSLADLHQTTLGNAMEKMQLKNTQQQEPELKAKMEDFRQKLKMTHSKHTIIEIRPRYLVCDTNCLIDHLVALQAILKWNSDDQGVKSVSQNGYGAGESASHHGAIKGQTKMQYTLLIPLVVVHELEKLAGEQNSASNDPYSNQHHAKYDTFQQHTAECASAALEFIHQHLTGNQKRPSIAPRCSSLLILTGRGNLLENLHYTTELSDSSGDEGVSKGGSSKARKSVNRGYSTRNDDIILRGCLKLIELQRRPNVSQRRDHNNALDGLATNRQQADMLANSTVRIERDVVFFTDDQNLKIKSHTLMVPTCSVGYFMKWACIPF